MHPLQRPVRLIIGLCAVIIGLNIFVLLRLQTLPPATPVTSRQAELPPIRLEPPATVAPCEPTVAGNEGEIAKRDTVIARLEAEAQRMKKVHDDDNSAWQTKIEQLEKDLMVLQKAAERVIAMDAEDWQEGKILLARAIVNKKT
ncbi:MAG: hypothetical protein HP493_09655 [Nitrospira sp.]|nr:hypothetical protein [Nitrospira sp.]